MLPPMPLARLKGRLWVGLVHVPSSLLGQEEKEEASCLPGPSLPPPCRGEVGRPDRQETNYGKEEGAIGLGREGQQHKACLEA